jgi:HSP90 family molecular chaperone
VIFLRVGEMNEALRKLSFVRVNAPPRLQSRIANVIKAISNSSPEGVGSPILEKVKKKETPLLILQDNADSFLALMRTLPKKSPFKEAVGEMDQLAEKLSAKLEESGQELSKILQTDQEDLPGIKATALGKLAELLTTEKEKLSELQELTKTLSTLAGKAHKEEKTSPVDHDMPSKDVGKKKKKESPGIGEDTGLDLGGLGGPDSKGPTPPSGGSAPDKSLL